MKGKYERGEAMPSIDAAKKIADALDVPLLAQASACAFLDKDEKVKASLKNSELLPQFKAVEQFTDGD